MTAAQACDPPPDAERLLLERAHRAWSEALGPVLGRMAQALALDELVAKAGFELLAHTSGPSAEHGGACRLWVHQLRLRDPHSGLRLLVGAQLLSWTYAPDGEPPAAGHLVTFEVNRLDAPEAGSTLEVMENVIGSATRGHDDAAPSEDTVRTLVRSLEQDCQRMAAFVREWAAH